jgi:ketosteroid isomerase-like protein
MKPMDVAKSYYAAFDSHDFARARALMRDDFRFVGPMMSANSPEQLFEQMKGFDCDFKNTLISMMESGNTVAALFDCEFSRPFKRTIRMSEWLTIVDGKIASANLLYDTRQMSAPPAA